MAELKKLDPVQGLVDYVLDIKPYHTKIMEVLVEYIYNEAVDITIQDEHKLDLTIQNPPGVFKDINTDPNLPPNWVLIPGSLLDPDIKFELDCPGGFDASGYSAGQLLITSPNPSISFTSFPAINSGTNSFIIVGNVVSDIKIGDVLRINSLIEDFTNTYDITSANVGSAGTASFVVLGDATAVFVSGFVFNAIEADVNNGTYSTASSSFDGTYTTIFVDQAIVSSTAGGIVGVVITPGVHTGSYTVSSVDFNGGSIDFLTNPTDPLTLSLGNSSYTSITVVEALLPIPALTPTQVYSAQVILDPIEVELSLSYSRAEKIYDAGTATVTQIPNEGISRQEILGITLSVVVGGIPVPDSGKIVLGGDFRTSNVFLGDALQVTQSTGNNGIYTITSIIYNTGSDTTTFGVSELIDDTTVDGFGVITIPANVFFVNGDRTSQFTQGRRFDLFGGSFEETYTILRSDFSQGKTRVRTAENIFNIGEGNDIISVTSNSFQVPGNQITKYLAGTAFNVIGSPQNDGPYIVDIGGATFDVITGLSTIPVVDTLDTSPGGELHVTVYGELRQHKYGFDESSPICGIVPDTIVSVYFNELLKFTGIGLELSDDLIAYNLENTDPGGFEYPLMTILSATTPPIPFQLNAPITPTLQDLWFDTTNNVFRQWNNYEWNIIKTANWFDTSANMLYYRTIDKFVDTGWVLDSIRFPGFNDFIPAVGEMTKIHTQLFSSLALSPGVPETTFTTSVPVPGSDNSLLQVTVNGIPAGFVLNTSTSFTVTSPPITIGDSIVAEIYDRSSTETNAHVSAFDVQPHMILHSTVSVDVGNNAYIVAGGNFIDKFVSFNSFTIFDTTAAVAKLGSQNTAELPIVEVNDAAGTISVTDDYTWLFTSSRIFRVNPSDRNYNDFEVQSSIYNAGNNTTTVSVIPFPFESDNNSADISQQYFYNPPLLIININNVADTITLPGKVDQSFPTGLEILIENSTVGNSQVWTVSSSTYDTINDQTNVTMTANIPDPDNSGNATVRTPIFQNYSKDLGIIIGAIFDPQVPGVYNTGQPNTIVLPSSPVVSGVNAIEYMWIGPVRFDISDRRTDSAFATIPDILELGDELTGGALNTLIVDTDATLNTFNVYYEDSVTGNPINLSDFFSPGSIFSVVGSYGEGIPSSIESNDARYVVSSVVWDYDPITMIGSGDTIVTIDTNFNNIPPFNSFNVVSVSNNGADLSTMTLSGDHSALFNSFVNPVFRLDQPIISVDPLTNVMGVTSIVFDGTNTILTIDNDFINEAFVGPIGIIEVFYRANIYYDEVNATLPWVHGSVVIHGSSAQTLTAATISDDLVFGWGDILRWNIVNMNQGASTIDLRGDFSAVIFPNDPVTIVGSQNIDGNYDASSVLYNNPTNISTVTLANPTIADTPASADINVTILAVGLNYFDIDGGDGSHIDFLRPGLTFDVVNSLANDGTYTIVTAINQGSNVLRVTVVEIPPALDDSGDVKYTKLLAGKLEMDGIDITPWFQYNITELQYSTSNLIISGNVTGDIFDQQEIRILGTDRNNGIVKVAGAPVYDIATDSSTVTVNNILPGSNSVVLLPSNAEIKVLGTAAMFLQSGNIITIVNSTGNNGSYIVSGVTFDGVYSFIAITTTFPDATPDGDVQFNERGGWIESLRYQGITLRFEDLLDTTITEDANAALVLTAGSVLTSWDYNYFDVGSFDENLSTVIHLYSNTL